MIRHEQLNLPCYTIAEACVALDITKPQAYRMIASGELPVVRDVSGRYRVPYGDLWTLLKQREDEELAHAGEGLLEELHGATGG